MPPELTKIFFAATQRFVNEPVEEIRLATGSVIKAVMEKQGHFLQCVFLGRLQSLDKYTLRRPVMGEVLSTRIWGVPPAGGPLL